MAVSAKHKERDFDINAREDHSAGEDLTADQESGEQDPIDQLRQSQVLAVNRRPKTRGLKSRTYSPSLAS